MKLLLVMTLLTTGAAPTFVGDASSSSSSNTTQELRRIAQALLDAVGRGDTSVWERHLAENCLYVTEDGRVLSKADLLSELRPLPPGYEGNLRMANAVVRDHGGMAVITYDALETLSIYGQQIHTRFHTTDTYLRHDGRWRMVASQVSVLPGEPKPVPVEPAVFDAYVGRYALAPDVVYTVTRTDDELFIRRGGGEIEQLFPLDETRFFREGMRGEIIFVVDGKGVAGKLIQRRDNNDIVWTRLKE